MKKADMTAVHEALEQMTVHVAKAAVVSNLNTRATVISAATSGEKGGKNTDVMSTTGLTPPLLSRFDLIFTINVVRHLTLSHAQFLYKKETQEEEPQVTEKVKKNLLVHITKAKQLDPTLSDPAKNVISL